MTWYVVANGTEADPEAEVWTLSEEPNLTGWENDCDTPGYGLTRDKAQLLADAANSVAGHLITENMGLRRALWAVIKRAGGGLELTMSEMLGAPEKAKFTFRQLRPDRPLIMTIEAVE